MTKFPLIRSFTIFSFVAFIITGTVLSWVTYQHITNDKLKNLYEVSQISVNTAFLHLKIDLSSNNPLSVEKKQDIVTHIREYLIAYDIKSISIFNSKQVLIINENASNLDKVEIGSIFTQLYENNDRFIKSNTFKSKDPNQSNSLNFNLLFPIKDNANTQAVAVIQFADWTVTTHAIELVTVIGVTMFGGLMLLFFLQIGLMLNTSRTLLKQKESLQQQNEMLEKANIMIDKSYKNTIKAISGAVDARDPYTAGHSSRVTKISIAIGRELSLSNEELIVLEYATLFHDIGKIGISDTILNKPEKLTQDEYDLMKKHPIIGIRILKGIEFLEESLPIIRHHHERVDGKGYPDGLQNSDIPLGARILAIADSYDAMTTDRPYRKGVSKKDAINEIIKNKGSQFDSELVDAFLKIGRANHTLAL